MKFQIEEKKLVSEFEEKEIEFPYFRWYSSQKQSIIKIYPEYAEFTEGILWLNCIIIDDEKIEKKKISKLNNDAYKDNLNTNLNTFREELNKYLIDFDIVASEEEFNKYREEVIEKLK